MKSFFLLTVLVCSFFVLSVRASIVAPYWELADSENVTEFTFMVYGEIPVEQVDYAQPHYLGGELENKWNTFIKNYTQVSEQSIGFASTTVRFNKPVIYNAVQKVNKYVRKLLKKKNISRDKAEKIMNHVFDCANVICFEPDSKAFEQAIEDSESVENILAVFEHTHLVYK